MPRDLTYISYGAGVQSTALLVCSNLGLHGVPRADVAIFADTGDEPGWVYETLNHMRMWSDIPVLVTKQSKSLLQDTMNRSFAAIPLYTPATDGDRAEGRLRRQCTREYKLHPIHKMARDLMGYKRGQRTTTTATAMIGISTDEVFRMKPSRLKWIVNVWPLVDARLRREDCTNIVREALGFEPRRSACVYCPYHSDKFWRDLRDNHPKEFERACQADEMLRDQTKKGTDRPAYVHRSLVPLREAKFRGDGQLDLFNNECEGMCGV